MKEKFRQSVILASRSPERLAIVREIFEKVQVISADIDETPLSGEKAGELVGRLSFLKAKKIQEEHPENIIISADTVIHFQGRILGKPKNRADAEAMLKQMSGQNLEVMTGTTLLGLSQQPDQKDLHISKLQLKSWSQDELDLYLDAGNWQQRAGAFSIIDPKGPARLVEGDLDSVRGIHRHFIEKVMLNEK